MLNRNYLRLLVLKTVLSLIVVCSMSIASPARAQDSSIYQGTATLTVELVNAYGQALGQESYTTNIEVYVDAAAPGGSNPFELVVQSVPLLNAPGEIGLWSSLPAEGVLFRDYQDLSVSHVSGTFP